MTQPNSVVCRANSLLGLLLVLALLPLAAAAASPALDWLQRMSAAMRDKNYTGTYVYTYNDMISTFRISHMRDADGERERLISLDGEAREIIRNNHNVICIMPGSKTVVMAKSLPRTPFSKWVDGKVGEIGRWYDLAIVGRGRVAGRDSTVIGIIPRDQLRYEHRIWIDNREALLLRSQLLNSAGEPVEQIVFTEMSTVKKMDIRQFMPPPNQSYQWQKVNNAVSRAPFSAAWTFDALPDGFTPISGIAKLMGKKDDLMTYHMTLSDGVASVSVYIGKNSAALDHAALRGQSQMGAVSAYGRTLDDVHITVVGEVPMPTAAKISLSIRRVNPVDQ